MMAREVLGAVRRAANQRALRISPHAVDRIYERGGQQIDIYSACLTASDAIWQPKQGRNGTWKLTGGVDTDGDDLTVCVVVENDVVVVTVM
jgi:hypothetical protein